jgi:hypothetical protein
MTPGPVPPPAIKYRATAGYRTVTKSTKEIEPLNGLTKPSEIFSSKVDPAFTAYGRALLDERLANNLARALNDQLEWTYQYYEKNGDRSRLYGATSLSDFRRKIFEQDRCPDARMMWDLADADHHRFLERGSDPSRLVTASTAAYTPDNGQLVVSPYKKTLLDAATAAVSFWRKWPD